MKLLTVKQVAEMLCAKPATVYQYAAEGTIPSYKLGGLIRFDENEIIRCVKSHQQKPAGEYNSHTGRRLRKGHSIHEPI